MPNTRYILINAAIKTNMEYDEQQKEKSMKQDIYIDKQEGDYC